MCSPLGRKNKRSIRPNQHAMLQHLSIRSLALLKQAHLEFSPGFTALTGETGAGKSVILSALTFLAGSKADKTMIAKDADKCEVEGVFYFQDSQAIDALLESWGLPSCEEGVLIIRRCLQDKASRCWINGSASTTSKLLLLKDLWIDFHGPGDHQKLFSEAYQLAMLDAFSENEGLKAHYEKAFDDWQSLLKAKDRLQSQDILTSEESALLQSTLDTFELLELTEEAIQDLEADFKRHGTAQTLQSLCKQCSQQLGSALNNLRQGIKHSQELIRLDLPEAAKLEERLRSTLIETEDILRDYQSLGDSLYFDEATIQATQHKMKIWLELKRKYGPSLSSIVEKKLAMRERLGSQGNFEARLYALEDDIKNAYTKVLELGKRLTQKRQQSAEVLGEALRTLLARLGFKKAQFAIQLREETTPKLHGTSHCQMLFSANPGQTVLPLNAIASSGEMARVMLALKALLAQVDGTPLLVFDEVDANVGGEIGLEVAKELRRLGLRHQVLCVTHLPQVAAFARSHWLVQKSQDESSTEVSIQPIDQDRPMRLQELARMLGDRNAQTALQHAEALLREGQAESLVAAL